MKRIIENNDGTFFCEELTGETTRNSIPFTKESDQYRSLFAEGCKVEIIPQSKKDQYQAQQEKSYKIYELENSISPRRYREASLGDSEAIEFIKNVDDEIKALRF